MEIKERYSPREIEYFVNLYAEAIGFYNEMLEESNLATVNSISLFDFKQKYEELQRLPENIRTIQLFKNLEERVKNRIESVEEHLIKVKKIAEERNLSELDLIKEFKQNRVVEIIVNRKIGIW